MQQGTAGSDDMVVHRRSFYVRYWEEICRFLGLGVEYKSSRKPGDSRHGLRTAASYRFPGSPVLRPKRLCSYRHTPNCQGKPNSPRKVPTTTDKQTSDTYILRRQPTYCPPSPPTNRKPYKNITASLYTPLLSLLQKDLIAKTDPTRTCQTH